MEYIRLDTDKMIIKSNIFKLIIQKPAWYHHPSTNTKRETTQMQEIQITNSYFLKLYQHLSSHNNDMHIIQQSPILQMIAFQYNHDDQIVMIRLSDGVTFLDCQLYSPQPKHHKLNSIIKLTEFETKLQQQKLSKIKVGIKKLQLLQQYWQRIGKPSELSQYLDNYNTLSYEDLVQGQKNSFVEKQVEETKNWKINVKNNKKQTGEKLFEQKRNKQVATIKVEDDQEDVRDNGQRANQNQNISMEEEQEILTGKDILNGRTGLFAGRLLRTKMTVKETKEGQLTVLILGLVDKSGQMIRVTMAGRVALKQSKQLKKGKCYSLTSLQPYQTDKMSTAQIKIKQKELKVTQIVNPKICAYFEKEYHRWDHQMNSIQAERVDVIGVIDDIDDQALYLQDTAKRVVRITVRNLFKVVKVSFWADQIQAYKQANFRKKQPVILEDIKKKKNKFLDYTYQSTITHLNNQPKIYSQYLYLLPEIQPLNLPTCISQIPSYLGSQDQPPTLSLLVTLTEASSQKQKIIYKICSNCKKKVDFKSQQKCRFCKVTDQLAEPGKDHFEYKYNWVVQFSDFSSTISTIVFDITACQIVGKNARQLAMLCEKEIDELVEEIKYCSFIIGVESKNLRFILRSIEKVKDEDYLWKSRENVQKIRKYLQKTY